MVISEDETGLLLIDIGRGTQDILLHQPGQAWENSIQLILPSPTRILAGQVREATDLGEDLFFWGETMGGGPLTKAVRDHLERGGRVRATPRAAMTFHDDPEQVQAMGVSIVGDEEEQAHRSRRGTRAIRTADIDLQGLSASLENWGISLPVRSVAAAVQDHGRAPRGMSDRRFRFQKFRENLARSGDLSGLAYTDDELPEYLTRMQGVRRSLAGLSPLLFMDTGQAALLGSLDDPQVEGGRMKLLLNVGNGHTLAALVDGEELIGFIEHHTGRLDGPKLDGWLDGLVRGEVRDPDVFDDGGHGAFVREGVRFPGWEGVDVFAATGPRRSVTEGLKHRPYLAAPHGQMMLTGNRGLYRAYQKKFAPPPVHS